MKTLEETFDIINNLNEDAHNDAFDTWIKADSLSDSDNEEDWDEAEAIREEASIEQSSYFRGYFYDLDETDQDAIRHWIQNDDDFKDQFRDYFGHNQFEFEFEEQE